MKKSNILNVVFVSVWFILFYYLFIDDNARLSILSFCKEHTVIAPIVLILTQMLLASFVMPCSMIAVLAGVLWGFEIGLLYSLVATILSSSWTFFLGRYLALKIHVPDNILIWKNKIIRVIDSFHWKASMMAHANPLLPGSSLGYLFGMSNIDFRYFFLGVLVGTLPLQLMIVWFGSLVYGAISLDGTYMLLAGIIILLIASYIKYIPEFITEK